MNTSSSVPSTVPETLARLEDRLHYAGQRLTDVRREVLQAMVTLGTPRTAYALLESLNQTRKPPLSPISLYRTLSFLTEAGVVVKLESQNTFKLCLDATTNHQHVVMICDTCGQTREIHDEALAKTLTQAARRHGHTLRHPVIELHGVCQKC